MKSKSIRFYCVTCQEQVSNKAPPRPPGKKKKRVQRLRNVFIRNKRGDSGLTGPGEFISLPVGGVDLWHTVMKCYDKIFHFHLVYGCANGRLNTTGCYYDLWSQGSCDESFKIWSTGESRRPSPLSRVRAHFWAVLQHLVLIPYQDTHCQYAITETDTLLYL